MIPAAMPSPALNELHHPPRRYIGGGICRFGPDVPAAIWLWYFGKIAKGLQHARNVGTACRIGKDRVPQLRRRQAVANRNSEDVDGLIVNAAVSSLLAAYSFALPSVGLHMAWRDMRAAIAGLNCHGGESSDDVTFGATRANSCIGRKQ